MVTSTIGWRTVWPKEGTYLYIRDLIMVGEIEQYLLENYDDKYIRIIYINGQEIGRKVINSLGKVKSFKVFMINNCGTGQLRIRVNVKDKLS